MRTSKEAAGQAGQEETGLSRRELLRGAVIAGLGAAGLAMASPEVASAAQPAESITAIYTVNANFYSFTMNIQSQSGNSFSGTASDGASISGTVTGARPDFNPFTPVTIVFTRVQVDEIVQTYVGAVATKQAGSDKNMLLAGVYYHNGSGPYPWSATGTVIG